MKLEKNKPEYYEFIRKLRNNPLVNDGFIKKQHITKKQQVEYMKTHNKEYYVCTIKNSPVGYIGIINYDIRIAVSPEHQKKGIGLFMVKRLVKNNKKAYAKIKVNNTSSKKLFEKAGFKLKYYVYEQEAQEWK